jgi:hypothetical protein
MNRPSVWLAQIEIKDGVAIDFQKTSASPGGLTAVFGAVGVVTVLLIVWAIFIRKRPNNSLRRYRHHSSRDSAEQDTNKTNAPAAETTTRKERRKRRRRNNRQRNPTLAETGGLPPLRADGYLEDPP